MTPTEAMNELTENIKQNVEKFTINNVIKVLVENDQYTIANLIFLGMGLYLTFQGKSDFRIQICLTNFLPDEIKRDLILLHDVQRFDPKLLFDAHSILCLRSNAFILKRLDNLQDLQNNKLQ